MKYNHETSEVGESGIYDSYSSGAHKLYTEENVEHHFNNSSSRTTNLLGVITILTLCSVGFYAFLWIIAQCNWYLILS
jgi:hypothetical protein